MSPKRKRPSWWTAVLWGMSLPLLFSASAHAQPSDQGEWGPVLPWPNSAIHTHVLPNGKVLFWGRREWITTGPGAPRPAVPSPPTVPSLDTRISVTRIWDPKTGAFSEPTNQPSYNLFCAGHNFLADGKLMAVGGHIADGKGEPFVSLYDFKTNKWETLARETKGGRWYPTVTPLGDGRVLVSFGTDRNANDNNSQEVWAGGVPTEIVDFRFPNGNMRVPPYYPRMHVTPDGDVFMTGPLALTQILDPDTPNTAPALPGSWRFLRPGLPAGDSERQLPAKEYGNSVMYDVGKIIYVGGGNPPSAVCEIVDLNDPAPSWQRTGDMTLPRRQHNATLLPDGTILVTGGTKGNGDGGGHGPNDPVGPGPGSAFNDLRPGQPLRSAEIWNPATGAWKRLAQASVDRCYHSTSVLLPDATVLSAGGGEYRPFDASGNNRENDPSDTKLDAQIFSPPYLFDATGGRAARPMITTAPDTAKYGAQFEVTTPDASDIAKVSCIRLPSVTHSFDAGQRINFLSFTSTGPDKLKIVPPSNPNHAPPGYYMLFILNTSGVPSEAKMIQLGP